MPLPSFKSKLKVVLFQVAITVGIFLILEISLRIFAPQINKTIFIDNIAPALPDSALGYVLKADASFRQRFSEFDVTYHINNQGYNQPLKVNHNSDVPILLFLGDSYTFGMGTVFKDSYVGLLT